MKFVILTLLFLCSCGKSKETLEIISSSKNIDKELQPYLDRFDFEANKYGKRYDSSKLKMIVSSELAQTIDKIGGDCLMEPGHPELGQLIRINRHLLENPIYRKDTIEAFVFHELGHCLMNRDHTDSVVKTTDGYHVYISLMHNGKGSDSNYMNNRNSYLRELFTGEVGDYTLIPDISDLSQFPADFYARYN
jgi:hypothetical protein